MAMPYVSPAQMTEYRKTIQLFSKGAPSIKCIRSHYFPEASGVCDLSGQKNQEELFVLVNRVGNTLKVSRNSLQIVANVIDIEDTDQWFEHLKEQRRLHKERLLEDAARREEQRKASAKNILVRKKKLTTTLSGNSSD